MITTPHEENAKQIISTLVRLVENPEVQSQLAARGYRIDWKEFNELIKDLTGRNFITNEKDAIEP